MDSTVYPKTGNTLKGDVKHDSMRQRFIGSTERQRDKKQQGEGGSAAMWMVSKSKLAKVNGKVLIYVDFNRIGKSVMVGGVSFGKSKNTIISLAGSTIQHSRTPAS